MCDFKNSKVGADELLFVSGMQMREHLGQGSRSLFLVFFHKYGCSWCVEFSTGECKLTLTPSTPVYVTTTWSHT